MMRMKTASVTTSTHVSENSMPVACATDQAVYDADVRPLLKAAASAMAVTILTRLINQLRPMWC